MGDRLRLRILGNICAAVTTDTLPCRTGMIHDGRRKIRRALVAAVAIPAHGQEIRWNVARGLTLRVGLGVLTAVTRRTGERRYLFVVHPGRRPAGRVVTAIARG